MKEQIEAKLGCTLDEYIDAWEKKMSETDLETEEVFPNLNLTNAEIKFFSEYYHAKKLA